MIDHDAMERVAVAAAEAGAAELRRRYRAGDAEADYGRYDVTAAADGAAEACMLPVVRTAFPDHAVFAEEAGRFDGAGDGERYRWVLDPLDGTNNFAAGLPTFATAVAVEQRSEAVEEADEPVERADESVQRAGELVERAGEPLLAALALPATGESLVARRGEGVRFDGERATADSPVPPEAATVAIVTGRAVGRHPERGATAAAIREAVDARVKGTRDSWAPTVHAAAFARGRIQGLVQYHPDEEERAATELLVEESGAASRREGSLLVAGCDEATLDVLWDAVEDAL